MLVNESFQAKLKCKHSYRRRSNNDVWSDKVALVFVNGKRLIVLFLRLLSCLISLRAPFIFELLYLVLNCIDERLEQFTVIFFIFGNFLSKKNIRKELGFYKLVVSLQIR